MSERNLRRRVFFVQNAHQMSRFVPYGRSLHVRILFVETQIVGVPAYLRHGQ